MSRRESLGQMKKRIDKYLASLTIEQIIEDGKHFGYKVIDIKDKRPMIVLETLTKNRKHKLVYCFEMYQSDVENVIMWYFPDKKFGNFRYYVERAPLEYDLPIENIYHVTINKKNNITISQISKEKLDRFMSIQSKI